MNDLDLYSEVETRSCQPLRCIQRSLSRLGSKRPPLAYGVSSVVRGSTVSYILSTAWLLVFIFCCFWCAIMPLTGVINYVFTARCTLVQSAVLRSHVVCLSVCLSVC